jgi:threonine dehydrogenase-like Zn-dependent dehydrogenase
MLAAIFVEEGRLELREVPIPEIKEGDQVLLQVEVASICGTDLRILDTPPGHPANKGVILGHEYVGRIISLGKDVHGFKEGDRVVVDPNITCGACPYCRMGQPNMCLNMTTLGIFIDGGFASHNVAPARALHKVSPPLPSEVAVFAEPLSCVLSGFLKLEARPGELAVVLGAGPIGLSFVQLFRASGAGRIIVSEVSPLRRRMALESGATRVLDPRKEDIVQVVLQETELGADIVVDAVGSLISEALASARRGGRILLFGQNIKARAEIVQNEITRNELTIMGSFIARFTFPQVIKMLESEVLDVEKLITHRFPLERISEGLEVMRKGEATKVIIKP